MKYILAILVLLAFYKSIFYAQFEYKEKDNKLAAIAIYILSFIGLLLPLIVAFTSY